MTGRRAGVQFSIITPSFRQLDWLRLCVASVADQVGTVCEGGKAGKWEGGKVGRWESGPQESNIQNPKSRIPPQAVEHIIQDAGSEGIEDFAREIGAEFYRDGVRVFGARDVEGRGKPRDEGRGTRASEHPASTIQNPESRHRIAVYCESDGGMYDAINRGFRRATGDVCAYLNCDEQYLPGALAGVAERFERESGLEMLFADAVVADAEGEFICFRKAQVPFRDQLWFRMPILSCATFFRRSILDRGVRVDETKKVLGDVIWIMRAQQARVRMGVLRQFTSLFTETEGNLGVGGAADREFLELRAAMPAHVRRLMPLYTTWHKVRSLLAGTRSHPPFDYDIFTRETPATRRRFPVAHPTAHWAGRTETDKNVIATAG